MRGSGAPVVVRRKVECRPLGTSAGMSTGPGGGGPRKPPAQALIASQTSRSSISWARVRSTPAAMTSDRDRRLHGERRRRCAFAGHLQGCALRPGV